MSTGNEQADGQGRRHGDYHWWLKRWKARRERRRIRQDLDYKPQYGKYDGYET